MISRSWMRGTGSHLSAGARVMTGGWGERITCRKCGHVSPLSGVPSLWRRSGCEKLGTLVRSGGNNTVAAAWVRSAALNSTVTELPGKRFPTLSLRVPVVTVPIHSPVAGLKMTRSRSCDCFLASAATQVPAPAASLPASAASPRLITGSSSARPGSVGAAMISCSDLFEPGISQASKRGVASE